MCKSWLLTELATDPERGQSCILTHKQAIDWEQQFAKAVPRQAEALAFAEGPEILARTSTARDAAERYRERLPRAESPYAQTMELRRRFGTELVEVARRLAEWPGVRRLHGTEEIYELVCLCILGYKGEVEGRQGSFQLGATRDGADGRSLIPPPGSPLNEELYWRIQFLVDWLIDEWNEKEGSGLSLAPRQ